MKVKLLFAKDRSSALRKILNRFSPLTVSRAQSNSPGLRNVRLAMCLALGLCLGATAWSKPMIQSVDVSPNPLLAGQAFTISVTASPDTVQGLASVDFRPGQSDPVDFTLTNQGQVFTCTGTVPATFSTKHLDKLHAKIKVSLMPSSA